MGQLTLLEPPPAPTLYPLDPLLELYPALIAGDGTIIAGPVKRLAEALHVDPKKIYRWRDAGGLRWFDADATAIAIGLHPLLLWPDF